MANITVHLYDLVSESGRDMGSLLTRIAHTKKPQRWRNIGYKEMALLETRVSADKNIWLLDFVKRRKVGPGKLRTDSELESFPFAEGEHFGEETSALIDLSRGWIATEYNQHGVRTSSMLDYLNLYLPSAEDDFGDWVVEAKLDPKAEQRLNAKTHIRAASLTVKLSDEVTAAMRDNDTSLGGALATAGRHSRSAVMSVDLSMSHSAGFLNGSVMAMLRRLAAVGTNDVRKLTLRAREGEAGDDEAFDLLEQRIVAKYSSAELEVVGNRYTRDSRWRSLLRLHAGWSQNLKK